MTGSFLMEIMNGLSFCIKSDGIWVVNFDGNDGKMLVGESIDYIVIKKWGLRGELFYLEWF